MPAEELTPFFAGTMNKFCPLFAPDSAAIRQFSASRFPPPLRQSRILNVLPPPDGSRNVSMRAGGGAFVSAETYGRGERGVERRGDPRPFPCLTGSGQRKPRRARLPPSPGRGVGLGPPCKHGRACPRNLRKRFSDKAHAKTVRSEALPCLKEDETASEERLGRAKAKPPTTPFQRQRFRAVLRTRAMPAKCGTRFCGHCEKRSSSPPRGQPAGRFGLRWETSTDWRFPWSPVKERRQNYRRLQ